MKVSHDNTAYKVRGIIKRDFNAAYDPSDDDPAPYRKKGKGKKACKRSKDGQHDWTGKQPRMVWTSWTEYVRDPDKAYHLIRVQKRGYKETQITVCARCGKPRYYRYLWR